MKTFSYLVLLLAGILFVSPVFATVQVHPNAAQTTTAASELKASAKAQKSATRAEKKVARQEAFANFINDLTGDSDEQLIAIILTLFLGGLGLHRLFLKSNPIIILWYFITFGGFFGLIPLIDLIRLIMGQADHYRGNDSLFRAFQS